MRKAATDAGSGGSCSVLTRPATVTSVPDVLTNGLPDPASGLAERLDRGAVAADQVGRIGEVTAVAHVQDAVGVLGAATQAVEVVQVAAMRCGAQRRQPGGGAIRAGQAEHGVTGRDQLGDDGGAGLTGTTGDENTHGTLLVMPLTGTS